MKIYTWMTASCLFLSCGLVSAANPAVRFIITGDTGTGKEGQTQVAKAMRKVCEHRGCDFGLIAGDNIYPGGVQNNRDIQFQQKFEIPFENIKFPFFLALGNHDQSGPQKGSGVYPEFGQFEVEYTQFSKKWRMPERYYSVTAPFKNPENVLERNPQPIVEILVIDSNPLAPLAKPVHNWYLPGRDYDKKQRAWLQGAIASSSAPWKMVMGHHPYRNNGDHGNAGEFGGGGLIEGAELKKMYEETVCGKVDFLFTGHDHSLQWLKPFPSCGAKPEFIISGAGAKTSDPCSPYPECHKSEAFFENFGTLGFFWAEATEKQIKIVAYLVEGHSHKAVFERVVSK